MCRFPFPGTAHCSADATRNRLENAGAGRRLSMVCSLSAAAAEQAVLSAFGSSVAEICHVYEEWPAPGADTDEIVERGKAQVRRDLEGERLSVQDARFEVEITDRVTVRGYSPVPTYAPQPRPDAGGPAFGS
jgi:hypothetical protein